MTKSSGEKVLPASAGEEVESWLGVSDLAGSDGEGEERYQLISLRPDGFSDYIGQDRIKENLLIACRAALKRNEPLDHILLHGPPGLGKTSLARIISVQMGVGLKSTSGPVLERPGDLAAVLTALKSGDILFIDEIHRLPRTVEEVLYPAMEDYNIDIIIGQGPAARTVKVKLKPFTLIGATTRTGMLTSPLRDRFGMVERLRFYSPEELSEIVKRSAGLLGVEISGEAADEIGRKSRGTPRIANRLLKRVRDFAEDQGSGMIDPETTQKALSLLEIDGSGLDRMDRKFLATVIDKFDGGPVGIDAVAATLGEERETLEEVYEPFLLQAGFIVRTRRGREATTKAYEHLGREGRGRQSENLTLF